MLHPPFGVGAYLTTYDTPISQILYKFINNLKKEKNHFQLGLSFNPLCFLNVIIFYFYLFNTERA
jgi:hypothetical protein